MDASRAEGCSSSSIPIPPQWVYDVFVSFRGADTRKKFTSHLFAALEGFRTFRDDKELERGEFISDGLLKAIEGSRMSLIVFSKDYAGSMWCLDELVKIMDCRETFKQIVVPIFYDVVPSEVRYQTGGFQDAFAKHKKRLGEDPDGKEKKWRAALTEATNLSGQHLLNDRDEAELIKMIIEDVRKVNPTLLNVPAHRVGLDRRVEELNVLLNMEFNHVGIVAIWGMGGIGKTTIAKRLFNLIRHNFERSGFLENVRETSQSPNGPVELQKKLLLAILNRSHELSNSHEGIEVIKKTAFGRKKVLLVLDDVDSEKQLKALAIDRNSFAPGSRIVITTRDKSSLKILELHKHEIYGPEKLDEDESVKLFSWHAFKKDHPPEDHLDLSRQIGRNAGGLPLALEVLGSYFRGKSIPQWERAIAKLRKIPADDVLGKLKISYDSLSEEQKKLFLDTACFFVGMRRDFTVKVLDRYDIFADDEIRKLADRCLIKYDCHDQIVMHDMIKDMGREIVRQESLDPGKRSRLWYPDDVLEVLRDGTGTEAVNGLLLNATDVQVNAKPFEKMDKLWYCEHVLEVRKDGMGLSELEDVVRMFVPAGEEELRIWFPYHDGRGPNVSFVVPDSPFVNQKMLGWILRLLVWDHQKTSSIYPMVWIEDFICNKIQHCDRELDLSVRPTDEDHVLLIYIPQGYGGLQLEGGDEVEIPMYQRAKVGFVKIPIDVTHPNTYIKKWAIDLIYEADEIHEGNDTWCQVEYNIQL